MVSGGREAGVPWGATVMATGIVSIGLRLAGFGWAWRTLAATAAALWVVLAVSFGRSIAGDPARWRDEASAPAVLTSVAGTGVVGDTAELAGHAVTAAAFLGVAAVLWAVLLPRVVRGLRRPAPGAAYLVTVATQSVAVLAALLAARAGSGWLVWPAGVLLGGGLVLYFVVLARFDLGQVAAGAGDHWVAGGSLAISTVAAARVTAAAGPPVRTPLEWLTLAVLAAVLGWYAVLAVFEVVRPRLRYDPRRWSTVFPLGMTATCTMTAGTVCHVPWLVGLGKVLVWPAVIAWAVVSVGALRRGLRRGRRPGSEPASVPPPRPGGRSGTRSPRSGPSRRARP
ncbi:tellurite resistance/C4-dicarboxylate transporter family protein [Actinomadura syzygii]|uniref:C4-dicarboxylate transporter n=1 Tax=Actinomadura syzygii TaxID=1427538 RepID=A0A5D0UGZ3_9ACTN|nr:tellurite resistance/C4-dicarboxylate transporter family protein [Actinomadura syzygii]TYC17781.1 hypothetical protein FXF65_06915 [Actinomadura syzygii]